MVELTKSMDKFTYLIIGGGVAGTTAAETIRARDREESIAIVSDEPYRFYSRIMLSKPNFFLEKIPFDQVWLKKESWYGENNIRFLAGKKAVKLDATAKTVTLDDGTELGYEKLLLAVGGSARKWTIPGSDKTGVLYLRTLDDAKAVIAGVKTMKRAVAIGGGFISFEMCEMMRMAGLEVDLILRESHYWDPMLDKASGQMIEAALEKGGVRIFRNAEVAEVTGTDKVEGVTLKDGTKLPCDLVIVGIGVFCPHDWLKESGVKTERGITANEYLETGAPDIWTAGDSAEFNDLILGERVQLGNWVNAQMQGRTAAMNILVSRGVSGASKQPFKMVSFYTTQGFGITIAFTGDVRPLPDRKIITRGSPEINSYARLVVAGDEVVGATLINRTQELGLISKIIEKDIKVASLENALADTSIDLKKIVSGEMMGDKMPRVETTAAAIATTAQPSAAAGAQPTVAATADNRIKVGWFSFSCCEDNTVVMTEVMNDHWQEWKKLFDFRHARVLKSHNVLDELDIAFIEGAIASDEHEKKLREIREKSKKLVAVGACAVVGMPAGQRNTFTPEQNAEIQFLLARFAALPKVLKVSDVVKVDAEIPGCPMEPSKFLEVVNRTVKDLQAAV